MWKIEILSQYYLAEIYGGISVLKCFLYSCAFWFREKKEVED